MSNLDDLNEFAKAVHKLAESGWGFILIVSRPLESEDNNLYAYTNINDPKWVKDTLENKDLARNIIEYSSKLPNPQ